MTLGAILEITGASDGPGRSYSTHAAPRSTARITGEGMVFRLSPISGITPPSALAFNLYFPAVLNTFTVSETALHNEYDTIGAGRFSQPAQGGANARQFRTMSIDSFTVDFATPWQVATGQDPEWVRARLYEILRSKKPVRLLATFNPNRRRSAEFDGYVTLRQISKDVRPGENDTRYLTVQISEWFDPTSGRKASSGTSRKAGRSVPATTQLRATDTLDSLSMEWYGSYAFWRNIRDANGITTRFGAKSRLVTLGGRWKVGANVKIPALAAKLTIGGR